MFLVRITNLECLFILFTFPYRNPMPGTKSKNFMIKFLWHWYIAQKPKRLSFRVYFPLTKIIAYNKLFSLVNPFTLIILILHSNNDDIRVIIAPEYMFVWVKPIIGQLLTYSLHIWDGINLPLQQIVDTVHPALQ